MGKVELDAALRPDVEAAQDVLLEALRRTPRDPHVTIELARLYIQLGRATDALKCLKTVSTHLGDKPGLHEDACRLLMEVGDFEAAVRQSARALAEGQAQLLSLHGRALAQMVADTLLGLSPSLKRSYINAVGLLTRRRTQDAAVLFDKVVRSAPAFVPAWIGLRGAMAALGDSSDAVARRWLAAGGSPATIAVAFGRAFAPSGAIFDPHHPALMRDMRQALTKVEDFAALAETPDAWLSLDMGGEPVELDAVIPLSEGASDRVPIRFETAEVFLAAIDNATLVGRGVLMTHDGVVVRDLHGANPSKYGFRDEGDLATFDSSMFQGGAMTEVKVYEEPALLLAGATDKSFGDWMINFMPRLAIARSAGLQCPVVISAQTPDAFIEPLRALGFRDEDIIIHDRNSISLFRKLYVPSWPMRNFLQPMVDLFGVHRDLALPSTTNGGRRIYLSREKVARRGLVNEAAVRDMFVRYGFEVVHPQNLTLTQMRELLAETDYVAAPYGSALLNLAYAGRKPTSIVCMPPQKPGFLSQTALWLGAMGLSFAYVTGQLVETAGAGNAKDAAWTVPLDLLETAIKTVLA